MDKERKKEKNKKRGERVKWCVFRAGKGNGTDKTSLEEGTSTICAGAEKVSNIRKNGALKQWERGSKSAPEKEIQKMFKKV